MACTIRLSIIGLLVIMDYKIIKENIQKQDIDFYLNSSINKIFAILGIYEDCERNNNLESYYTYLNRTIIELSGFDYIFETNFYISIISILVGMLEDKEPNHKKVKSITFHCISLIKKGVKNELL